MEGSSSRPNRKRPFEEDDGDDDSGKRPPAPKRVRFPKGKKVKKGDSILDARNEEGGQDVLPGDPRLAAKERAMRRSQITAELVREETRGITSDISAAEVAYEVNETFDEGGIEIEPFNLNKEREEGYFDADGNFVEYVNDNEIKDAWLDSVEAEPKYTGNITLKGKDTEDGFHELSANEVGEIKRRIADLLEPGETVLQALRRLKGTSNDRKEKMSAETKRVFDQLTEDAMKLMDNGEYNVYHEKQEVFRREAEGYEILSRVRGKGISTSSDQGNSDLEKDLLSDIKGPEEPSSLFPDPAVSTINPMVSTVEISGDDSNAFDIFADDDAVAQPSSVGNNMAGGPNSESEATNNDYVYDESSGYYYSSSLGYYYDPSTGLYCSAASGKWYFFSEETNSYNEIIEDAAASNLA